MEVNDLLIDNLANLARLEFAPGEKEGIRKDLEKMIAFVEKLSELDCTGVEPLLHMGEAGNIFREDIVTGSGTREEALRNAPKTDGVYFQVPKVIKNPADQ